MCGFKLHLKGIVALRSTYVLIQTALDVHLHSGLPLLLNNVRTFPVCELQSIQNKKQY